MTNEEAIKNLTAYMYFEFDELPKDVGIAMSAGIVALREQAERDNPKPLSLEELREMDGEPVWVEKLDNSQLSGWHVVDGSGDDAFLVAKDRWRIPVDCLGNYRIAYRYKPREGTA